MEIREHKPEDLDRILEIWLNSNIDAHNFIDESYWTGNYEMVKEFLPKSKIHVYTVYGIIVGFIGLKEGKIEGLFVDENYRNRGIGKALMDRVKSENSKLELYVFKQNEEARRFYKREGFIEILEELEDQSGEMGILMRYTR